MTAFEKFAFDNSFDDKHAAGGLGSSVAAQLDDAFKRGHAAGLVEARSTEDHLATATLQSMAEQLVGLEAGRVQFEDDRRQQAVQVSLALVAKMLPKLTGGHALGEIEGVITDCLRRVVDEPRIVFRVPDPLLDTLQARMGQLASQHGFQGEVVLLADASLGPSDCRVEWADGGADRNVDALWQEVEEIIQRALGAPVTAHGSAEPADAPEKPHTGEN